MPKKKVKRQRKPKPFMVKTIEFTKPSQREFEDTLREYGLDEVESFDAWRRYQRDGRFTLEIRVT